MIIHYSRWGARCQMPPEAKVGDKEHSVAQRPRGPIRGCLIFAENMVRPSPPTLLASPHLILLATLGGSFYS